MEEKKERTCEKNDSFDYESLWKSQEEKKVANEPMPRGLPRNGIKGKYLKKKGHVGRQQLKNSWGNFYKSQEGKDIVED